MAVARLLPAIIRLVTVAPFAGLLPTPLPLLVLPLLVLPSLILPWSLTRRALRTLFAPFALTLALARSGL